MAQAVFVSSSYSLPNGQNFSFSDPWSGSPQDPNGVYHAAFVVQAPAGNLTPITFVDAGAITVTDNSATSANQLFAIGDLDTNLFWTQAEYTFNSQSLVTITGTGSVSVTAGAATQAAAYGYYSQLGAVSLENDGSITVGALGASAVYGVALALNAQPATSRDYGHVTNTGTISVSGLSGAGVALSEAQTLTNAGSIVAQGGAWGVDADSVTGGQAGVTINNSGQITASGGAGPSIGIGVSRTGWGGTLHINNTGTITADHAIEIFVPPAGATQYEPQLVLHNSGTVNGSILIDAYSNGWWVNSASIYNTGHIVGDIVAGASVGLYDGRGGTLTGTLTIGFSSYTTTVYLGDDGETVHLGNGSNSVYGGAGADHVTGGAGDDFVSSGGGNDVLDGGGGTNTLSFVGLNSGITVTLGLATAQTTGVGTMTLANFQRLIGTASADHLSGGAGNDVLDGGGGNDLIDGGGGTNTIAYSTAASGVTVNLAMQGSAQDTGNGVQTLSNIQNVVGTAYADHIIGDANDNVIESGGGADVLDGGGGNNTVSFAKEPLPSVPAGQPQPGVNVSLMLQGQAQNIGPATVTLSNFQNITGSAGNDILEGDSGNNVLNGSEGNNTVTYAHATAGVTIQLSLGGGIASGSGSGFDTLENIQNAIGSAYDDTMEGTGFGSVLDGGGGTNTVTYANAFAGVTVSLALQGSAQNTVGAGTDTLTNFRNLTGSTHDDTLEGDGNNNVLDGGTGTNTISYAHAGSGVTVSLALQGAGQNTVGAGYDTLLNFQNLTGSTHDDHLTGDNGNNVIDGGGGNDVLDGGGGANTASFASASAGVTVSLALQGQAQNTGAGSDTLSNFQNLTGSAFNDVLAGDSGNNVIDGGGGTNTVSYAAAGAAVTVDLSAGTASGSASGSDTLVNIQGVIGSAYDDHFIAGGQSGRYDGGGGANTLDFSHETGGVTIDLAQGLASGSGFSDTLANIQTVIGSNQNDRITFGAGAAAATGGLGADTFVSLPGEGNAVVTDFTHTQGDKIDLSAFSWLQTLQQVKAAASQQGGDTVIALLGSTLTLQGVLLSNLTLGDFTLGSASHLNGDLNGDHEADVIFRDPSTGDWGYAAMTANGYDWHHFGNSGIAYAVAGEGDFNGDGVPDVIFRDPSTGDWGYAAMNASGYTWVHLGNSGVPYAVAGTGDFNHDGRADVLFRDPSTGDWGYAAMTPQGYNWVHLGNSGVNYAVAGTGDFNGDGRADVLFRDPSTGDWGYAAMTAQGFDWHHFGNSGVNYAVAGTGDFNGDGYADVLFRDPSTGDWGYAAMNPQGYTWVHLGNSGVNYTVGGTGDFNGDGRADVIFRDASTGDWGYAAMTAQGYDWHHEGNSGVDYLIS